MNFDEIAPEPHDPDEVLDYAWDFSIDLQEGESIISHSAEIEPDVSGGPTVDNTSSDGTIVIAWISGGVANTNAKIIFTVTTDNTPARTIQKSVLIRFREK